MGSTVVQRLGEHSRYIKDTWEVLQFLLKEYAKARYCKLSLAKEMQEVGLTHSSKEVYESIWSQGVSIQIVSLVKH